MTRGNLRLVDPTKPEFYARAPANDDGGVEAIGIILGRFIWRAAIVIACAFTFLAVML